MPVLETLDEVGPPPCVFGTSASSVRSKAGRQIGGDARIKAVVPAFEDVDHPTHLMA